MKKNYFLFFVSLILFIHNVIAQDLSLVLTAKELKEGLDFAAEEKVKVDPRKQALLQKIFFSPWDYKKEKIEFKKYSFDTFHFPQNYERLQNLPQKEVTVVIHSGHIDYKKAQADEMRFIVNFANEDLFHNWETTAFHQDEVQSAEFYYIPHIRHYLRKHDRLHDKWEGEADRLNPQLNEVALIMGITRFLSIDTEDIYGRLFASASPLLVVKKAKILSGKDLQKYNLLAMEAPYRGQLEDIFVRAFSGFWAAKKEANKRHKKLVIDTGAWGCGVYGNDPKIVAMAQILAAQKAGVDVLNYYSTDAYPVYEALKFFQK